MPACGGAVDRPDTGDSGDRDDDVGVQHAAGREPWQRRTDESGVDAERRTAEALLGKPVPSTPNAELPIVGSSLLNSVPWVPSEFDQGVEFHD